MIFVDGNVYGCPIGCKYCMVTHIDARRDKWNEQHRYGINKTVFFVNKLEGEKPLREMNLNLDYFKGEYVGFEGITDAFNPIFEDDLKYMVELSKTTNMKKLVLVTKWPISEKQFDIISNNKKILLVVSLTGLDMLENVSTKSRIEVIKKAKEKNIDVLPIIHPYIHKLSNLDFIDDLEKIGIKEISLKGFRYNDTWMGEWGKKLMSPEIYKIYFDNQEKEILLGEEYVIDIATKHNIRIMPFREYVHRDNGTKGIKLEESKKIVDDIFSKVVISSSDTNNAVYEETIKRRL